MIAYRSIKGVIDAESMLALFIIKLDANRSFVVKISAIMMSGAREKSFAVGKSEFPVKGAGGRDEMDFDDDIDGVGEIRRGGRGGVREGEGEGDGYVLGGVLFRKGVGV